MRLVERHYFVTEPSFTHVNGKLHDCRVVGVYEFIYSYTWAIIREFWETRAVPGACLARRVVWSSEKGKWTEPAGRMIASDHRGVYMYIYV